MVFSLATLSSKLGPLPAVEVDGKYYRVEDVVPGLIKRPEQGLLSLLENWAGAESAIARAVDQRSYRSISPLSKPTETQCLAPILYPSKIICTGVNYYDHLRDDAKVLDFDKSKFDILYFLKHSHALVGAASGVRYPSQSKQFDWEVELAVVFGRSGRRIPADKALDYVAGYCIGLDLTARDWQTNPRHFRQFDLMAGKSFDDSSPLGPHLVPARFVDPTNLKLQLWVNDDLKQNSSTREMVWSIPEQIAQLSQHVTLEAGDVLYTGSPAGIGWVTKTFLKVGDRIKAEITGLGRLVIDVIPDPDAELAKGF
jgi:2-keto-4-pentenoate hydratase/2-oxohepta-3-ene-1,7-dioic acid hydratase in catechol pathway